MRMGGRSSTQLAKISHPNGIKVCCWIYSSQVVLVRDSQTFSVATPFNLLDSFTTFDSWYDKLCEIYFSSWINLAYCKGKSIWKALMYKIRLKIGQKHLSDQVNENEELRAKAPVDRKKYLYFVGFQKMLFNTCPLWKNVCLCQV